MRLPWEKKYLVIGFHVVVTALAVFTAAVLLANIKDVGAALSAFFGGAFKLFSPVFLAAVMAYVLDPLTERLQNFWESIFPKKSRSGFRKRTAGALLTYLVLSLGIFILVRFLAIKLGAGGIDSLAEQIKASVSGFGELLIRFQIKLAELGILDSVDGYIREITQALADWISNSVSGILSSFGRLGEWVLRIIIGITVAWYFLAEKEKLLHGIKNLIRTFFPQKSEKLLGFFREVNAIFSGYIGGQVTDALIMSGLVSVSFCIAGIPYAVLIGVISGFSNLVPYIGAFVAFLLSVTAGLFSDDPMKALYAAVIVILLQQLDSAVIVPRIVGNSVKMHPVLVIMSIYVFGRLFGLWGMFF
ncbi:MAG: AI-2E family transporter, partial [Firmicutes bacterium]|nr:AI-2E family transporter [Bacillota bacterium]